jgi:hypothetical protein
MPNKNCHHDDRNREYTAYNIGFHLAKISTEMKSLERQKPNKNDSIGPLASK